MSRALRTGLGVVLAVVVVGGVAYARDVTSTSRDDRAHGGASHRPRPTSAPASTSASAAPSTTGPTTSTTLTASVRAAAVYYLGAGPRGTVLYREFQSAPASTPPLAYAVQALGSRPVDPDYRTPWRPGWLVSARTGNGVIGVEVTAPARRPAGMTARDATEAVQQVVYTMQAAAGSRARVQFTRHGAPAARVLGVATGTPLAQGSALQVLSQMSITDPAEGRQLDRGPLVVTGVNNGFEASVLVQLKQGDQVVLTKPGMASGWGQDRLFPWRVVLDTSKLPAGTYTLVASNDDPGGGGHPATDTRTIELK